MQISSQHPKKDHENVMSCFKLELYLNFGFLKSSKIHDRT